MKYIYIYIENYQSIRVINILFFFCFTRPCLKMCRLVCILVDYSICFFFNLHFVTSRVYFDVITSLFKHCDFEPLYKLLMSQEAYNLTNRVGKNQVIFLTDMFCFKSDFYVFYIFFTKLFFIGVLICFNL